MTETVPIGLEDYKNARESLIRSRATHLDQLSDKLKESRVKSVIAPILESADVQSIPLDDADYVIDLGLVTKESGDRLVIANRIYQEIIPRELLAGAELGMLHKQAWYLDENNHLQMDKLLAAFQQFYRENAAIMLDSMDYKEAAPQLLMQAYLQRVVNGGGRINREYALGRKRTDLTIEWPTTDQGFFGPVQRVVIELKIQYGALETTLEKGVEQVAQYADAFGADECHLVIFNRDLEKNWDDKMFSRMAAFQQRSIWVWGC